MSSESSQPQPNTAEISIKDEFGILYQQLKEIRGGYDADVMKTVAFLIIAIGWFITSEKSRDFFRKNRTARILSLYAVVVICCIHVWYSVLTYLSSHKLISSIKGLNYLDFEHYSNYEITTTLLAGNLVQNGALFAVLIVILYSLKDARVKS